jgi:hypothetical protein
LAKIRLVLTRNLKLAVLILNYRLNEPHVFKRDRSLVGKRLEQCNLFVSEWTDFGAPDGDDAERRVSRASADMTTQSAIRRFQRMALHPGMIELGRNVGHVNRATFDHRASGPLMPR